MGTLALALLLATPCAAQTNLITNGSFDEDVLDWEPIEDFMSIGFDPDDVDESEESGSAGVVFNPTLGFDTSGRVVQCVSVLPGRTYTGSASLLIPADQNRRGSAGLRVVWYESADCTNSVPGSGTSDFSDFEGAWTDLAPFDVVAPQGVFSAEVQLEVQKPVLGGTLAVLFDDVVFVPEPARSLGESVAVIIVLGVARVGSRRNATSAAVRLS